MNDIEQYINQPGDFRTGIELMERYGGNPIIIRKANNLKEHAIPCIIYELKKLAKKGKGQIHIMETEYSPLTRGVPEGQGVSPSDSNITIENESTDSSRAVPPVINLQTDPILFQLTREMQPLLQERSHLHEQLFTVKDQKKRAEISYRIVQIDREDLPPLYAKKEFYLKNGRLPDVVEQKKELAGDPLSLQQRKLNLRSWISRYRNSTNKKYIDKIVAWEEELEQIDAQLLIIKGIKQ